MAGSPEGRGQRGEGFGGSTGFSLWQDQPTLAPSAFLACSALKASSSACALAAAAAVRSAVKARADSRSLPNRWLCCRRQFFWALTLAGLAGSAWASGAGLAAAAGTSSEVVG